MVETIAGDREYRNLIGGEWARSEGGETYESRNPADTSERIGRFQQSTRRDIRQAVEAAREAFPIWAETPPPERGRVLYRAAQSLEDRKEQLAQLLTREEGKTIGTSRAEVQRAVEVLRFYGGMGYQLNGETISSDDPDMLLYTRREPVGAVGIITPWNFPIAIPAWKLGPALVSGNAVVFKPAELTPLIATQLVDALQRAGLPNGVINVVTGLGDVAGDELVRHPQVEAISFTGSYEVGAQISRATGEMMKRNQLELGGKNAMVVLEDADLDQAAAVIARSAFGLTGQACTATSRAVVVSTVIEPFMERIIQRAQEVRIGNGLDEEVDMGPAVSEEQLEKDVAYIEIGERGGATLACGGRRLGDEEGAKGYFIEPTIFSDVDNEMRIAQEEIFGPVLSVIEARDFGEAIELVNDSAYGLTAGICTRDLDRAHQFVKRVETGVVKVNRPTVGLVLQAPYGGIKRSSSEGLKEQGRTAIEFYTRLKTAYLGYR